MHRLVHMGKHFPSNSNPDLKDLFGGAVLSNESLNSLLYYLGRVIYCLMGAMFGGAVLTNESLNSWLYIGRVIYCLMGVMSMNVYHNLWDPFSKADMGKAIVASLPIATINVIMSSSWTGGPLLSLPESKSIRTPTAREISSNYHFIKPVVQRMPTKAGIVPKFCLLRSI